MLIAHWPPPLPAAEEAPSRLHEVVAPWAQALESWMSPLRTTMSIASVSGDEMRQGAQQSELVKRLRTTLFTA